VQDDVVQQPDSPPPGSKIKQMAAKLDAALADDVPALESDEPPITKPKLEKPAQPAQHKDDGPTKAAPKKGKTSEPSLPKLKTVAGPEPKPAPDVGDEPGPEPEPEPDGGPRSLDDDDAVPPSIKSQKAADDFKLIKKQRAEAEKSYAQEKAAREKLEGEIAELRKSAESKPTGPSGEEYKNLVAERDKLQQQLETVALERSDRFQAKYKRTFESAISRAKNAVGDEHAAKIEGLMALPSSHWRNQQIEAIRESIETGVGKGQLDLAVAQMDAARDDQAQELTNAHESYKALQEEEKQSAEKLAGRVEAERAKMVEDAKKLAAQSTAFVEIEGKDDHNALVKERFARLEKFLKGGDPENAAATLVKYAVMAEEDQFLTTQYIPALQEHIKTLEEELSAISGAEPSLGGTTPTTPTKSRKRKGFTETYLENMPQT
jgi:hypothetical protein